MTALTRLEPLLGVWTVGVEAFGIDSGRSTFEWALGGSYLLHRSVMPGPVPDSLGVIAPDDDGFTVHYFDSRGVTRLYAMTFDGTTWTQAREAEDFSPLTFRQRFTGVLEDGGQTIRARWEHDREGDWDTDFEMVYRRIS